jgi:HSP20 family protein
MQERLESLFGRATTAWCPPGDLTEYDDRYVLTLELPGLSRADINVEYLEPLLTIRGKRSDQGCCPERYQQLERGQGDFCRTFQFERTIRAADLTADLADGVLTVTVPKGASTRRQVEVG